MKPGYAGRMVAAALGALVAAALPAAAAPAAGACAQPHRIDGFTTCADVAAAEHEGALVFYTTDPGSDTAKVLAAFHQAFPAIATNFIRLQAGALYAKLLSERRAHAYVADVMEISDMGFVLDFQKRGGYARYVSPEMSAYKAAYMSQPEGYWTWGEIIMAGIAYNPKVVPPDQAPTSWLDVINPKWKGEISVKDSNSGLEHETWYELRRLYGDSYWKKFAALQPKAYDSYVQQYSQAVNGQDQIIHTAQYSGYLEFKARGAPIAFVYPADGLPAGPGVYGVISHAPHPQAARLFMDWLLSVPGQEALDRALYLNSPRDDVPPPPGGVSVSKLKLLFPTDWHKFLTTRSEFNREWNNMVGLH